MKFNDLVEAELIRARQKHSSVPSRHHAMSVITEEFIELRTEVYNDSQTREVLKELVHLAATCQRFAEDVLFPEIN